MENERAYTFKDIMEDPGLAFRLSTDEVKDLLETFHNETLATIAAMDAEKPKARKEIASKAAAVSSLKVRIDDAGKRIVDGWKKEAGIIDSRRKMIREVLESLRDAARDPVTQWEARQKAEADAKAARLAEEALKIAQEAATEETEAPATLTPETPETPATDQTGSITEAPAPGLALVISRDASFISFNDKDTEALVFRCAAGGFGKDGALALFALIKGPWGGRVWNTHGKELHRLDMLAVHGRI